MQEQSKDKVSKIWRTMAIIFIVIFIVILFFLLWAYVYEINNKEDTYHCYYTICEDTPDAFYDPIEKLCTCYDYDVLGNIKEVRTKYLK